MNCDKQLATLSMWSDLCCNSTDYKRRRMSVCVCVSGRLREAERERERERVKGERPGLEKGVRLKPCARLEDS